MSKGDKPLISILMAVYEPNMDWLREQLLSLNAQTYSNLRLYVRDDCSTLMPYAEIVKLIGECITAFPYTVERNERNLGSNLTFERLTREAGGDIFAYCDQDDVWLPEKLDMLQMDMEREGALLVCSDMYVIDGTGDKTANSITEIRKRHILLSGTDLAAGLLTHNFVTGCTMIVNAEAARAAIPFCPYMVHDHYLALCCAAHGKIYSEFAPTICYRQHGNNQTGLMSGVKDKASYGRVRIDGSVRKFQWLQRYFSCDPLLSCNIDRCLAWMLARQEYWRSKHEARVLWNHRDCGRMVTFFELFAAFFPEKVFMWFITLNKKNII